MSPQNVKFWLQYQQAKMQEAYKAYTEQEAQVYCEKDSTVRSDAFMEICEDHNVHPDNFEMHVREVEGWSLDEYDTQLEISEHDLNVFCGLA